MMTKKEQREHEELLEKIRILGALRWTEQVNPDLVPSKEWRVIVNGWQYNTYNETIHKACTDSIHHSYFKWDKTDSHHSIHLYSTELLAPKGLRHAVELECAQKLAKIDKKIEEKIVSEKEGIVDHEP